VVAAGGDGGVVCCALSTNGIAAVKREPTTIPSVAGFMSAIMANVV